MSHHCELHISGVTISYDEHRLVVIDPERKLQTPEHFSEVLSVFGLFVAAAMTQLTNIADAMPEEEHQKVLMLMAPKRAEFETNRIIDPKL